MKQRLGLGLLASVCAALLLPSPSALADGDGPSRYENRIKNSSFEVGTDGYAIQRGEYVKTAQPPTYYAPTPDSTTKTHGLSSLRIDNPNGGTWRFFSKGFKVEAGKTYVLSMAAKSANADEQISVNLDYTDGAYDSMGGVWTLSKTWKRYSLAPVTIKNGHRLCNIQIMYGIYAPPKVGGAVWLDALQVEEQPTNYQPRSLEVGIVNGLPRPYTTAAAQNFPVSFKVRNNSGAPISTSLRYSVEDEYFKKTVSRGETKPFILAGNSTLTKILGNISPKKRGKYILKVDVMNRTRNVSADHSEFDFAVIDSVLKKADEFTEAFAVSDNTQQRGQRPMALEQSGNVWALYGSSVDEMFDFRAQAGDRWIRSWDFGWANVETADNEWDWRFTDLLVAKARARGIRIMPVLMTVPGWVQTQGLGKTEPTIGGGTLFMPSMEKWERYVRACATRYKGIINTWEVENEPNLWMTQDQYLLYLQTSYRALKAVDPHIRVVAFSASQDYGGNTENYLQEMFKKGALKFCDVVTIHPYGARLDWTKPVSAEALNARLRKLMNQYGGADKELWVGELFYIGKNGGDNDMYVQRLLRGHEYARRYLIDLSTGIGQSLTIPDTYYFKLFNPESWAVNLHLTGGMIPGSSFVIHNTLARIFEGAKPRGEINLHGQNKLYLYSRGNLPQAASWSFDDEDRPSLLTIPNAAGKLRVLDIMGNPSDQVKTQGNDLLVTLTNSPLYFLPKPNMGSQLRPLLSKAQATSGEWIELAAGFTRKNKQPAVVVQLSNPQAHAVRVALGVGIDTGSSKTQSPSQQVLLSPRSVGYVVVPIQSQEDWQSARIALQAKFGSQTVEKMVEVKSHPALDCPRLKAPVQLDGRVDAAEWQDANQFTIDRREQINDGEANWQGPDDISAVGHLKYDAKGLYLGIQVKDQTRRQATEQSPVYDNDAIELFLDAFPNRNLGETFYGETTAQLLFGLPNRPAEAIRQDISPTSGKTFAISRITSATLAKEGGYDVEIMIPWSQMKSFVPSLGAEIGFDLSLDDADEGPHRKVQMVWAGKGKNYEDRTLFGRVILK